MRDIRDQCRQDVPTLKTPKDWSLRSLRSLLSLMSLTGLLTSDLRLPISDLRFNHTILSVIAAFAQNASRAHGANAGSD